MKEKKEVKVVGLGFAEALALLFVGLKLGGAISWSWLWVLSPILCWPSQSHWCL